MPDELTDEESRGLEEVIRDAAAAGAEDEHDSDEDEAPEASVAQDTTEAEGSKKKKKKSKRKRVKDAIGMGSSNSQSAGEASEDKKSKASDKLRGKVAEELLRSNPALQSELAALPQDKLDELIQKMSVSELMTGMAIGGKNQKDMASYKFWQTQPVPRFDDKPQAAEGPIKIIDPAEVSKEPSPLVEGFEWVTMDLTDKSQLVEVYTLLNGHYVEDDGAMFRFSYSVSFLNWALKAPGWRKEWHVGVRAVQSRKLVAFISGIPMDLRVREKTLRCSEINFLCIHKKLRAKRLTPVLIKEITRRCNEVGIWQAIYTAGVILPKPVSSCRYFHRSIDWLKLNEINFSPLPHGSTKARQISKYHLPNHTATAGLRPMRRGDVDVVLDLLTRYLARFDMAPVFTREEVEHWLVHEEGAESEQVVWTYVVEEPESHRITDFFSFYALNSSVIGNDKHDFVLAAYLFYYASETAFNGEGTTDRRALKARLNALIEDALILAKEFNFDVFNALTLLDNPLFLEQQKFGPGDGQLHYYLYNYRTAPIAGGVDERNNVDETSSNGVGVVML
ncbi:MAG: glycylpeptide N-tetradecanoyltransferase [Sarcosagium campestre]|nr:MAG: glycylpeptide N-tetradecanoyltransferase [Sarcosagium campestre]